MAAILAPRSAGAIACRHHVEPGYVTGLCPRFTTKGEGKVKERGGGGSNRSEPPISLGIDAGDLPWTAANPTRAMVEQIVA